MQECNFFLVFVVSLQSTLTNLTIITSNSPQTIGHLSLCSLLSPSSHSTLTAQNYHLSLTLSVAGDIFMRFNRNFRSLTKKDCLLLAVAIITIDPSCHSPQYHTHQLHINCNPTLTSSLSHTSDCYLSLNSLW